MSGVYDFDSHEDRVRFILSLPLREQRRSWLEYFERQYGKHEADRLKADVIARFKR